MISADVKSNIKQQQIKDLVAASYKLLDEITFKTSNTITKLCIFQLILVDIPSILILSVKNRRWVWGGRGGWGGGGLLNRQNLLRAKKVICRQSLNI